MTDAAVAFEGGADLSAFRGNRIRLKFELAKAKLYAFAFGD